MKYTPKLARRRGYWYSKSSEIFGPKVMTIAGLSVMTFLHGGIDMLRLYSVEKKMLKQFIRKGIEITLLKVLKLSGKL